MDELSHGQKNTMGILMTGQNNIDLTVTGRSGRGRYIYAPVKRIQNLTQINLTFHVIFQK